MKRVHLVVTAALAVGLGACCSTNPRSSGSPSGRKASSTVSASSGSTSSGSASSGRPWVECDEVKQEVDRVFDERHPGVGRWALVWLGDRGNDLLDILEVSLSFGRGMGVNLRATEYLQAGVNWWDGMSWGMRGRAWGVWETREEDRGVGPFYWVEHERRPVCGTASLWDHEYKYTGWDLSEDSYSKAVHHDWTSFGGSARVIAVGAEAAVSPLEALDFVGGVLPIGLVVNLFGYHHPVFDVMQDDTWSELRDELVEEKGLGQ
jgi:hypothetical protein